MNKNSKLNEHLEHTVYRISSNPRTVHNPIARKNDDNVRLCKPGTCATLHLLVSNL